MTRGGDRTAGATLILRQAQHEGRRQSVVDLLPIPFIARAGSAEAHINGEIRRFETLEAAQAFANEEPRLILNVRMTAARLNQPVLRGFDLLDLFAFVWPARFVVPTTRAMSLALGLDPNQPEARQLLPIAETLLGAITATDYPHGDGLADILSAMRQGGWLWADKISAKPTGNGHGLTFWADLKEWPDSAPPAAPMHHAIAPEAAESRLEALLGDGAEERPGQKRYARVATEAFKPAQDVDEPHTVLAEAGTGTGKTLGYLAPASLWAETNKGTVWVSTYTRNLQRQIDGELDRLYQAPAAKAKHAVIRKGRENYLCLLNYEEKLRRAGDPILLGLIARWARASRDGDLVGGDLPGWLAALHNPARVMELADRRGECVYSACQHYKKCFVERATRKARHADIVIANHALVMAQAVYRAGEPGAPTRIVFDEGHHLFEAADSAFSVALSGRETAELRRWLLGAEGNRASRGRGLANRIQDLIIGDEQAVAHLQAVEDAARVLPATDWRRRLSNATPRGEVEALLSLIRTQVYARQQGDGARGGYSLECGTESPLEGLIEAAQAMEAALDRLKAPLAALGGGLARCLDDEDDPLETSDRQRIEAVLRGLSRRSELVTAWQAMLADLGRPPPESHIDWFEIERIDGRESDVALRRHWIDPTRPLSEAVLKKVHGALITSATLRDKSARDDPDAAGRDWQSAEMRTGAQHLIRPARRAGVDSPFDYPAQTRIFIVQDVDKRQSSRVAAAMSVLMKAAGGGAIGLFTAVERLRQVHGHLLRSLEEAGLPLLAQHIDPLDVGTLIDMFRAEENACLLGTDAVRDGVDVPGRSLRLLIFDRVPWPRPSLLHKARRAAFSEGPSRAYDEMLTRAKLAQAYGRLIRRQSDRGVFVILDRQTPTRLLSAFPDDVVVERVGLAEAVTETHSFLSLTEGLVSSEPSA